MFQCDSDYFGTGLFDYCTCDHCGLHLALSVCLSDHYSHHIISISFYSFPYMKSHCRIGIITLVSVRFMGLFHLYVCLWVIWAVLYKNELN